VLLEPGLRERRPERGQRVEQADGRVDQIRIVILPAGLVLLRAAVVVDRQHDLPGLGGRSRQVDGGLAAVRADLHDRTDLGVCGGGGEQRRAFRRRHEAPRRLGEAPVLIGQDVFHADSLPNRHTGRAGMWRVRTGH
jgi:hypothetical protein